MEKIAARRKVRLTDVSHEPKDEVKCPSLEFVHKPKVYC